MVSQLRAGATRCSTSALLRKPTFTGGLLAAFGVSASVFSLLTYLVIYVQNVLGYSAVEAGVRFLFLSGAAFVAAAVAGRLTEKVPAKWLIAPGFVVLGVGLLLIHGIEVDSSWTHLIPGLVVCGLGVGMINTPLASTAVGVVPVDRAGHGLRHQLHASARSASPPASRCSARSSATRSPTASAPGWPVRRPPASRTRSPRRSPAARSTPSSQAAPAGVRDQLAAVATSSFVDALNHITLIAAVRGLRLPPRSASC